MRTDRKATDRAPSREELKRPDALPLDRRSKWRRRAGMSDRPVGLGLELGQTGSATPHSGRTAYRKDLIQ
jgi:hypothetical protein